MMIKSHAVTHLPQDDHSNGWSSLLPVRVPCSPLEGDIQADWLIVGSGYAGIAAARQLAHAQPQASIVVLDAGVVGENASGRNSGFAGDLPHIYTCSPETIKQGKRLIQVNRFALNELDHLIQRHEIACDWKADGRYHVAVSQAIADRSLRGYADNLSAWGEPFEWCDRQQLSNQLGTNYYSAGIYLPRSFQMNPAALIRGLADSLPKQIQLYENSPVIDVYLQGAEPWARTDKGRVRAGGVILAVNAFSQSFGVYRDRHVPVLLFASLTCPLTANQRAQLGSDITWGLTPATRITGATLRLTIDGRLLIRQDFEYSPNLQATEERRVQARAKHLQSLRQRFPQLDDLTLDHFWMGWISVSRNQAPAFGQIGSRSWAVTCCNGSGIVRHTAAGMLIADLAVGRENPLIDDFLAQGQASYIPPRPLRDIGLWLTVMRDKWRSRAEQ